LELVLDGLVTLVGLVVVAAYAWSGKGHFASDGLPRGAALLALMIGTMTVLCFVLTWLGVQPLLAQIFGLGLQLAGAGLFVATISASRTARLRLVFDPEHPRSLVETGPYAHVRHPFYVSYIVFWAGWALATWSVLALIGLVVVVAVYWQAARREERLFASSPMAAPYAAYQGRTGFLWPRFK
jgi:protein-S-isoprenylcysteine O-methyltransferase Ste14